MAVCMEDRLVREESAGRPQVRDDPRIRLPHLLARVGAGVRGETASRVDRRKGGKAEPLTELEVLRSVPRGRMDEPRVLGGDRVRGDELVDPLALR